MIKQKVKIKILVTDTAPLYPPLWGGPKRIWGLYSNFKEELFDITYVGVSFDLGNGLKYKFNKIRNNFKEILCSPPPHYYHWHALDKLIFKNTSLDLFVYLGMHTDWQFRYILNSQSPDIIICSHPWSSLCIHKDKKQFFIYDAHNCEYLLMERILAKHIFKRFVLGQVKRIEGDACKKSNLVLVCSEKEKKDFIDLYKVGTNKIIVIPNGTNINKKEDKETKIDYRKKLCLGPQDKVVIFIGAYYKPNIDAVRFILEKIAPLLKDFKFLILGTASDFFKGQEIPKNTILFGRVSDEQLHWALGAADIAVNPMFDGSGINIKMLDYMSYGLPIVSTECGARGIETNGKRPMIVTSSDKFVDNIKILSADSTLSKQMSEDGVNLAIQLYDWRMLSQKLEDAIMEKLN